jgi:hypothetical protein
MADTQTSFVIDDRTAEILESLKKEFGVKTNAAVIRKALALANVAARSADADHTVTILDKDRKEQRIFLAS